MNIQIVKEIASYIISIIGSALLQMVFLGFLGLIAGIIVLVVCNKKGIFNRSNQTWNSLTKINYIFIPVVFIFIFGLYGMVSSVQSALLDNMGNLSQTAYTFSKNNLREIKKLVREVNKSQKDFDEAVETVLAAYHYQPKTDTLFEKKAAGLINYFISNAGKGIVRSIVISSASKAVGKPLEPYGGPSEKYIKTGIEKFLSMKAADFNKDFAVLFTNSLEKVINHTFKNIFQSFFLLFLVLLAVPVADFLIYKAYRNHNAGNAA